MKGLCVVCHLKFEPENLVFSFLIVWADNGVSLVSASSVF